MFDAAPEVIDTFPVNGATDFPVNANLTVTFSEPVNVTVVLVHAGLQRQRQRVATSFSGGPTTFTLDPGMTLVDGETCTLTVLANQVSDQDGNDPPDNMVFNFVVGFTAFDVCVAPYTPIYAIQGSGSDRRDHRHRHDPGRRRRRLRGQRRPQGFYLQDLTGDGDPATSDGIFVFTGSADLVSVGQVVRVTGFARERFNQTTLNGSNSNIAPVPAANIVALRHGQRRRRPT